MKLMPFEWHFLVHVLVTPAILVVAVHLGKKRCYADGYVLDGA